MTDKITSTATFSNGVTQTKTAKRGYAFAYRVMDASGVSGGSDYGWSNSREGAKRSARQILRFSDLDTYEIVEAV